MTVSEKKAHIGNLKDIIWYIKGYIATKQDFEADDICKAHHESLIVATKLLNDLEAFDPNKEANKK